VIVAVQANTPLRGELLKDEPLARYTSWRVGGPARQLYRPADAEDLSNFLASLPADEPLLWLGLGSNILVRDGGFPGTVIIAQGRINDIRVRGDRVYAEAGAACAHVARLTARLGLTGAAFLAGIPGTMGGALAMNAGAFGGETWNQVMSVQTIDRHGEIRQRFPADYEIGYRYVRGPQGEWFLSCELQLAAGDTKVEQAAIRELLDKRAATQPTGQPSCGSTFRNPPGDHAARLIERAGLKGYRIGGAQVSEKHANFVINTGDATAADIEQLIDHMQRKIKDAFGVELVREVHILGVPA
jgi:UDP-N-acetylmuramate dehydrogenase